MNTPPPRSPSRGDSEARSGEQKLRADLARDEQARGPDHPSLCPTLIRLGLSIARQGRAAEAEPIVERALHIAERSSGAASPAAAQILIVLAQVQASLGKIEAKRTAERALEGLSRALGATHPTTVQAKPILEQIIASFVAARPELYRHDGLTEELERGVAALRAHDPEGSIDLLLPVVDRAREAGAPAVESYARGMLAQALFVTGKREEALAEVKRAATIAQENQHHEAIRHFADLATQLEAAKSAVEARGDFDRRISHALEHASSDPDGSFREISAIAAEAASAGEKGAEASARIVLGQIHFARHELDRAEAELRRAQSLARQVGDPNVVAHVAKLLDELA